MENHLDSFTSWHVSGLFELNVMHVSYTDASQLTACYLCDRGLIFYKVFEFLQIVLENLS